MATTGCAQCAAGVIPFAGCKPCSFAAVCISLEVTIDMGGSPWNSLELAKLLVGILTPIAVAGLGWFISRELKRFELHQWTNQKLIEKRIAVYDVVGPKLNELFCFFMWVGNWKDTTPDEVLRLKRQLDQQMYVYAHIFEKNLYYAYREFIETLFDTYQGAGVDAKIRSLVRGPEGNRSAHSTYEWKSAWEDMFSLPEKTATLHEIEVAYGALLDEFSNSFGVRK